MKLLKQYLFLAGCMSICITRSLHAHGGHNTVVVEHGNHATVYHEGHHDHWHHENIYYGGSYYGGYYGYGGPGYYYNPGLYYYEDPYLAPAAAVNVNLSIGE